MNTVSALQQLFKKEQTGMLTALQNQTPQMRWLKKTPLTKVIPSGLEMRLILDVMFQGGGAMIPDGGYESTTTVQPPQYGTVTFVQYNGRFGLTGLGRMYDRYAKQGEVLQLNYYAARKVLEGMGRKIGYQHYGYSTGTVAVVDTTATVSTNTNVLLKQPYGTTLVANTNAAATTNEKTYLAQLFRAIGGASSGGDMIGPIHSADVVTNGQGSIVSTTNSTGSINVTTAGGSSTWTAGDPIVFFNAVTDTTKAGTELNLWPNGLFDVTQSTSLHGLATSTAPNWASYTDSSGGRMGYVKLNKVKQYIDNYGGTTPDVMDVSNGVENDMTAAQRSAMIYSNTSSFDLDGNVKAKGIEIRTSLLSPPGIGFVYDSNAYTKLELGDLPSDNGSPDLFTPDKLPNQDQWAFALNYAYCRPCTNRAAVACLSSLTEQ